MMSNFLISGSGRSGTKFLARILNQSEWTVCHEPENGKSIDLMYEEKVLPEHVQERFNRDYYGEVNSRLRWVFDKIDVDYKGLIFRNPVDIWLSAANRNPKDVWPEVLLKLEETIPHLINICNTNPEVLVIDFRKMVSNVRYIQTIAQYMGIQNLRISEIQLDRKINATEDAEYESLEQFNNSIEKRVTNLDKLYRSFINDKS